ncbi:asparagine--tRNA ligase [Candidatus Bathyarchaeota archaeon ex4484_205]|nr:MAG: asparagine--tRNA ligase [Candidatus Bathyarchaeota archaeon ex4484_205]
MLERATHTIKDLWSLEEGTEVSLYGWVRNKREHGDLIFIDLRDGTGIIQVSAKRENVPNFEKVKTIGREYAIFVSGKVVNDRRAPRGREIRAGSIEIVAKSEPFPIKKGAGKKFLLDMRHLHIRSIKVSAVMRVRSEVCNVAREWLRKEGFVEIHAPSIITMAVEGGATLFPIDYFGERAYLTQSSQFYEEAAITGLGKVYTLQPSFRAEMSRTRRHLTEFWHLECEMAFSTHEDVMNLEERLISHIAESISELEELSVINRKFEPPQRPFERISYDEAIEILKEEGYEIEWGEDEGYGEITTGGQRIHDYESLLKRIEEEGLNPEDYSWYLELRKYGMPPHSGFGLGIERLIAWICGLEHVRDACLFPRTPSRVRP